jgi:hypothetical protein
VPSLHVRLTAEQHTDLRRAARDNERSLQREIVFRLFRDGGERSKLTTAASRAAATVLHRAEIQCDPVHSDPATERP